MPYENWPNGVDPTYPGMTRGVVGRRGSRNTFKVQVGPAQIALHQGRTVLVGEPDGTDRFPGEKGLYLNDTRVISS